MSDNNMNIAFMNDQIEEIQKHKWIESEKAGHDLGVAAERDWVRKYAALYREHWFNTHDTSSFIN